MQIKDFAKIFFVVLLAHLAVLDVGENVMLIRFTKPIILLSLIAFYIHHTSARKPFEGKFLFALMLSLVGDVLLMFTDFSKDWFMFGLAAFLVAQVYFSVSFLTENPRQKGLVQKKWWLVLPFMVYGIWFVILLYPGLSGVLVPVYLYAFMLMMMAIAALNRNGKVHVRSFQLVFAGALLFVLSDSVLAYAKFVDAFPRSAVVVMATYGIAQFLMVWGMLFDRLNTSTDLHQKQF